ncbi:MAG: hypothetical protein JNJ59_09095 [Deltaproteobacteria bacterium]|jgi:hypothetical protein|nr:hypothetical protein [Deltaproteobacteria bacterium]
MLPSRLAFFVVVSLSLSACGVSHQQRVSQARGQFQNRPGVAQATDYARTIWMAFEAEDYARAAPRLKSDTDDAIGALERVLPDAGSDASYVMAWRARMMLIGPRVPEAEAAYLESHRRGPNEIATMDLVRIYGLRPDRKAVAKICAESCEVFTDSNLLWNTILHCRENMNASTEAAASEWMSPNLKRWYAAESSRRESEYQAARAQAQREEVARNRIQREGEMCASQCTESMYTCQNRCRGSASCKENCRLRQNACVDGCSADMNRKLGQ